MDCFEDWGEGAVGGGEVGLEGFREGVDEEA